MNIKDLINTYQNRKQKSEENKIDKVNMLFDKLEDLVGIKEIAEERLRIMSWDESMIQTVKVLETHSKCSAKKVCCLIVSDTDKGYNILSIGLNGSPKGKLNCCDKWKRTEDNQWLDLETNEVHDKEAHSNWSIENEIHAEINALAKCNQSNTSTLGTTAFISYSPCTNCAKTLVAFGIKKIVFADKYKDFDSNVKDFLCKNNIEVIHLYKDENNTYKHEKYC